MGELRAELGHAVAVLDMFAGKVVQLIQILGVGAYHHAALGILHLDGGFEQHTLPFLDELSH